MTKRTEAEYEGMADWAENDMTFCTDAPGIVYGAEAAEAGRAAVARALGGLPSIDPDAKPGDRADG